MCDTPYTEPELIKLNHRGLGPKDHRTGGGGPVGAVRRHVTAGPRIKNFFIKELFATTSGVLRSSEVDL